jgi:hypothetical protein
VGKEKWLGTGALTEIAVLGQCVWETWGSGTKFPYKPLETLLIQFLPQGFEFPNFKITTSVFQWVCLMTNRLVEFLHFTDKKLQYSKPISPNLNTELMRLLITNTDYYYLTLGCTIDPLVYILVMLFEVRKPHLKWSIEPSLEKFRILINSPYSTNFLLTYT